MSRADNRHHAERMKRRVRNYSSVACDPNPRRIGKTAVTRKPCSCWMCANERATEGPTMQEKRHVLARSETD